MALNLLVFVRIGFVGKLTKRMNRYNKQAYWSNIDGAYRPTCMIRIAPYILGGNWRGLIHGICSMERAVFARLGWRKEYQQNGASSVGVRYLTKPTPYRTLMSSSTGIPVFDPRREILRVCKRTQGNLGQLPLRWRVVGEFTIQA
jgi:hypothetical protein